MTNISVFDCIYSIYCIFSGIVPDNAHRVEDMYAKVHKRGQKMTPANMEMDPEDLELPMGASAIKIMRPRRDLPKGGQPNAMTSGGARPKTNKSEINYSDFEVALYDKDKKYSDNGGGYETLPDGLSSNDGYESVPKEQSQYEQLPDYWRSTESGGGYETVKELPKEPGYETVGGPREASGGKDPGYEIVGGPRRNTGDYESIDRR